MCIGDATAQPTRPGHSSSVAKAATIGVSTARVLTFPRWNFFRAIELPAQKPAPEATGCTLKVTLMSLATILIILLILILLGVIPRWGYSNSWGYGPSGIVGTILVIVVILLLLGRI
jgi:hypothetical protein